MSEVGPFFHLDGPANHNIIDGPAIRNANRGDSRKSIRANRLAEKKPYFPSMRAISANRLKPAIRNFSPPKRDSQKKRPSSGTLKRFARIRRFARIGPSKFFKVRAVLVS